MTFEAMAGKLQEELIGAIQSESDINDYELIVYKYVFITELGIPLFEDLGIEICEDSFILYIIPDDLEFALIRDLVDAFDRFHVTFMPNSLNIIKLRFKLNG